MIWNIFPNSDIRGRASVEKLIGELSESFPLEFIYKFIDDIIFLKEE
jgi:hypothetical protein